MSTTEDDGPFQPCNMRQALFYAKTPRFLLLFTVLFAWKFGSAELWGYGQEPWWNWFIGFFAFWSCVAITSAPSESPEWKRLQ